MILILLSAELTQTAAKILFKNYAIDGYLRKARLNAKEFKATPEALAAGHQVYPRSLAQPV